MLYFSAGDYSEEYVLWGIRRDLACTWLSLILKIESLCVAGETLRISLSTLL
jgi:hypothetical protein